MQPSRALTFSAAHAAAQSFFRFRCFGALQSPHKWSGRPVSELPEESFKSILIITNGSHLKNDGINLYLQAENIRSGISTTAASVTCVSSGGYIKKTVSKNSIFL